MPQGFKGWAIWAVAQVILTGAFKLAYKLLENALIGWGDEKIAVWFGITSPDASTAFDWALPFALAALTLWAYHTIHSRLAVSNGAVERQRQTLTLEPRRVILIGLAIIIVGLVIAGFGAWRERQPSTLKQSTNAENPFEWGTGTSIRMVSGSLNISVLDKSSHNEGGEEVILNDAYLISGITGERRDMKILVGNTFVSLRDIGPIPPRALVALRADFNESGGGISEAEFFKEWSIIYFVYECNGKKFPRQKMDEKFFRKMFDGSRQQNNVEPHVTLKKKTN